MIFLCLDWEKTIGSQIKKSIIFKSRVKKMRPFWGTKTIVLIGVISILLFELVESIPARADNTVQASNSIPDAPVSDGNIVTGDSNSVQTNSDNNVVSGWTNNISSSSGNTVSGAYNWVTDHSFDNAISGEYNRVDNNSRRNSVSGDGNTISNHSDNNAVSGSSNIVTGDNNLVSGAANTVTGSNNVAAMGSVVTGDNNIGMGSGSQATAVNTVAIGNGARATHDNAVALGSGSVTDSANTVSVGSSGNLRRVTNVAQGVNSTDAVNKSQLDNTNARVGANTNAINDLREESRAGIAAAAALIELMPSGPGKTTVNLGTASYMGSIAIGQQSTALPHLRISLSIPGFPWQTIQY